MTVVPLLSWVFKIALGSSDINSELFLIASSLSLPSFRRVSFFTSATEYFLSSPMSIFTRRAIPPDSSSLTSVSTKGL